MATDPRHPEPALNGAGGGAKGPRLNDLMRAQYARFDPFQLVRLLCWPEGHAGGEPAMSGHIGKRVTFKADWSAAFPGVEVTACRPVVAPVTDVVRASSKARQPQRWSLATPNYCIGGELGPLPETYTEWLRDQQRNGDVTGAAFLDLFNHRFNVLRHELKSAQDISLNRMPPEHSTQADYLAALAGLYSPHVQQQIPLPRRVWLGLTGMLAIARHSSATLKRALQLYLGAPVSIEPLVGGWFRLESNEQQQLGRCNNALGRSAVIGSRGWDESAGIRVNVTELDYARFCSLLPDPADAGGQGGEVNKTPFNGFAGMLQLLLDRRQDCHVRLQVRTDTCPQSRLTGNAKRTDAYIGLRLGQTAWLSAEEPAKAERSARREANYLLMAFPDEVPA